ncbi:MAG TPA: DNA-directed RNA polymerase subunit beta', partial [Verrucomicrobiota bacterium]|nr:DNA-directed RNA polymerase subunit beta' [Verrucomicrobiota bacterium]
PFIIRRLKEQGYVHTVRSAKKMIERQSPEVWDILEEVTKEHPVLLNRAPTLHRLSIQAFEPLLIEGEAIRIHPLVCTAYNADFDGDQMAVHVPLSVEAQLEARLLMMASHNIFNPSSGKPIMTPTQDITLGCYYLTAEPRKVNEKADRRLKLFGSRDEVLFAHAEGDVTTHEHILLTNPDRVRPTVFGREARELTDEERRQLEQGKLSDRDARLLEGRILKTTVGRVIFNEIWPEELGFFNKPCGKSQLGEIIFNCYKHAGHARTVEALDRLKELGFREATRAGVSIGIDDMIIPKEKLQQIESAQKQIADVDKQYRKGVITPGERYNKVVDIWTHCTDQIASVMLTTLEGNQNKREYNPVFLMVDSGARGNKAQVRQLAGVRGLMAKPSGDILSNFREGLTVLEYFISTHGARKGLADTALKTADSGYMTRKLVDVAQDVIIRQDDCRTTNGIFIASIYEGEEEVVKLADRVLGRFSAEDVYDPNAPKTPIVRASEFIDEARARLITSAGLDRMKIRSVLTCEAKSGICMKCYGRNLATGRLVELGEAVGIIAAQSIGEPGTQLTMRTFHIGGAATQAFKQPQIRAKHDGFVRYADELRVVEIEDSNFIVLNKNGSVSIHAEDGRELETHSVPIGAVISVPNGGRVKGAHKDPKAGHRVEGQVFVQWDPYNVPILSEKAGKVHFHDVIEGVTIKYEVDEATAQEAMVVIDHKEDLHPQVSIVDAAGEPVASYAIPAGAHIVVTEGAKIVAGSLLAKTPRKQSKTKDITGGLPRVAELFEARRPKDAAEISRIDGVVDFGATVRGKRCIIVRDSDTGVEEEHLISIGKHLIVFKGDQVKKGQQLTEGPMVPHEILEVCGAQELQEHLVNEIQEVYRLQGVTINDKHIEIIIRQMLRKVRITEPGDTTFLWGEQVDKLAFEHENRRVED